MMPTQALQNLLSGTRYNIAQIDADLATMAERDSNDWNLDLVYHQGYQNGRKAELESLADILAVLVDA